MKMVRGLVVLATALLLSACPIGGRPNLAPDIPDVDLSGMDLNWWPKLHSPDYEQDDKTEDIAPSKIAEKLKVGDIAYVTTNWSGKYMFHVYRVSPDSFGGLSPEKEKYKVMYNTITKLTVHRKQNGAEYARTYFVSDGGGSNPGYHPVGTTQ